MKLSPISQNLMKEILKQFDTLALPRTQYERRMIDNTFKILYNDIKRADAHIENLLTQHKIKSHIVEFKMGKVVPMTTLFNSHFVNDLARKYVVQHLKGYLIFEVELEGHKIELYFALLKPEDFIKSYRFEKYMKQMFMWLYLAALYSPNHCAENLKIFCFLTPFRKKIPRNQYSILSPAHCNSAVTTSCTKNGEIVIFREEEICKVLIHESFHVFGLDFSNLPTNKINNKMVKIFPIESEFNLFEAYSGTWASILNSLFSAYGLLDDKDDVDNFLLYADSLIQCEQIFSLFQCIKVLNFMDLSYQNLYTRDEIPHQARKYLYKEKTNAFAYYIVRSILMFHLPEFLAWCRINNTNIFNFSKSLDTVGSFGNFIESHYKRKGFMKKLEETEKFKIRLEKQRVHSSKDMLLSTMRMSLCELK